MDVLIGERYLPALLKPLEYHGFSVFGMPDNPLLDPRLSSHADLSALRLPEKKLIVSRHLWECRSLVNILTNRGFELFQLKSEQGDTYPGDAVLCACLCGDKLMHRVDITDQAVRENFDGEFININQGYARCTICPVAESSIITSDEGAAAVLKKSGWNVLKIDQGLVHLEGFNYGFIGGASIVTGRNVYFTGRFPKGFGGAVEKFVKAINKDVVYLTDEPIFDIGGAVDVGL